MRACMIKVGHLISENGEYITEQRSRKLDILPVDAFQLISLIDYSHSLAAAVKALHVY